MEFHQKQLGNHCRVCGKKLFKAKNKATVYQCTDHKDALLKCFEIYVSRDDPLTHPLKLCNPCYAVTRRSAKATANRVHYTHTVEVMDWSPHTENGCLVRRVVICKALKTKMIILGL